MSDGKRIDKLEEFCKKCAEQGITYAESQRREWIEEEHKKKEYISRMKELERRKQRLRNIVKD